MFSMRIFRNRKSTKVFDVEAQNNHTSHAMTDCPAGLLGVVTFLLIFATAAIFCLPSSHSSVFSSANYRFFPKTMYKARDIENCPSSSIERLIAPPGNLMHNMTDEELLWRASVQVKREGYPFQRVPKVAFMFLTRGELPFQPLWERFFKGHEGQYSVYVHTAPGYKLVADKTSAFYDRQIPSKEVIWGEINLLDAERRLLANALLDFSNERFIVFSESCIPLYNFPTIYNYITSSPHSFLDSFDQYSPDASGRYPPKLDPEVTIEQWRKGAAWFEVSREVAVIIVAETKYYNLFHKYCNLVPCFTEEHYLATYLSMFHGSLIANRTLTWTDWSARGSHPRSYGGEDVTEDLIQSIRKEMTQSMRIENSPACDIETTPGCYLFARKFAPSALEPLLKLSSTVLGFDK